MTRLCDHVSHMTSVVEMELVRSALFVFICCASVLVTMVILHAPGPVYCSICHTLLCA